MRIASPVLAVQLASSGRVALQFGQKRREQRPEQGRRAARSIDFATRHSGF
jgi:hypothetical protein